MSKNCPKCGTKCGNMGPTGDNPHLYFCPHCEAFIDDVINIDEIKAFIDMLYDKKSPDRNTTLNAIRQALELKPEGMRYIGKEYGWDYYKENNKIIPLKRK